METKPLTLQDLLPVMKELQAKLHPEALRWEEERQKRVDAMSTDELCERILEGVDFMNQLKRRTSPVSPPPHHLFCNPTFHLHHVLDGDKTHRWLQKFRDAFKSIVRTWRRDAWDMIPGYDQWQHGSAMLRDVMRSMFLQVARILLDEAADIHNARELRQRWQMHGRHQDMCYRVEEEFKYVGWTPPETGTPEEWQRDMAFVWEKTPYDSFLKCVFVPRHSLITIALDEERLRDMGLKGLALEAACKELLKKNSQWEAVLDKK